jgi:hypothetical protein
MRSGWAEGTPLSDEKDAADDLQTADEGRRERRPL